MIITIKSLALLQIIFLGIAFAPTRLFAQMAGVTIVLRSQESVAELELLDRQVRDLGRLVAKAELELRAYRSQSKNGRSGTGNNAEIGSKILEGWKTHASEILVPWQLERLSQLGLWAEFNSGGGLEGALEDPTVLSTIELTEEEGDDAIAECRILQKEFELELQSLRRKYRSRLEKLLEPEEKERLNESIGKANDFVIPAPFLRF